MFCLINILFCSSISDASTNPCFAPSSTNSKSILENCNIDPNTRVSELREEQVIAIRNEIADSCQVEGELRGQVSRSVKRLMDIGSYRGLRHKRGLPTRGQNTKNNSRTRKGKKKTVSGKKSA